MGELLVFIGERVPFVAVGVCVLAGLIGLVLVNRGGMQARTDRRAAAQVAGSLALIVGGIAATFVALFGMGWGGTLGNVLPPAIGLGLAVAAIPILASAAGYAGLARWRPASSAVTGAWLGPLVLGATLLAAIGLIQAGKAMTVEAAMQREAASVQDRSTGFHLTVDDVDTTLDEKGLVATVHVQLTIRSDAELRLGSIPEKVTFPIFFLYPNGVSDPSTEIQLQAPLGSPDVLTAGGATSYDLQFDMAKAGTPTASGPGDWRLRVMLQGTDGVSYEVSSTIVVRPD